MYGKIRVGMRRSFNRMSVLAQDMIFDNAQNWTKSAHFDLTVHYISSSLGCNEEVRQRTYILCVYERV